MYKLSKAVKSSHIQSIYTSPCTVEYIQNEKPLKAHLFAERGGVIIVVYNTTRNVLVLVKQFRPALYILNVPAEKLEIDVEKHSADDAVTLEWCAGTFDKNLPIDQIAQEELLEELGYDVPLNNLEQICNFVDVVTTSGAKQILYYCEVTDDMKTSSGGGVDDECIEIIEMKVPEVHKYIKQSINSPPHLLFGFYWFLENKYKQES